MASLSTSEYTPHSSPNPKASLESSHHIQCDCDLKRQNIITRYLRRSSQSQTSSCWRVQQWAKYLNFPRNAESIYSSLLMSPMDIAEYQSSLRQIELDLSRTYPDEDYFNSSTGEDSLRRVLSVYCKYDPNLGYVQGMNYIVGALLWHCSEVDAFWIFVGLMERHELRDVYLPKFPGLSKHCQIIHLLMIERLPSLHAHFARFEVLPKMYVTEWCFSLFAGVVPANEMVMVFDQFFYSGWIFFYKFVVFILKKLEKMLLQASDLADIIIPLKICHKSQKEWKDFVVLLDAGEGKLNWKRIINEVNRIEVDEENIKQLHLCFDIDKAEFVPKGL
jgi:hypothetical protein